VECESRSQKNVRISPHLKEVTFIWSCAAEDVYGWFKDAVEYCIDKSKDPQFPKLILEIYITRAKTVADPNLKCGRPNLTTIFKNSVNTDHRRFAVFACGPTPLVNSAWDECNKLSLTTNKLFEFHHETFDF